MKHAFLVFLTSLPLISTVTGQVPEDFGYIINEMPDIALEIR